MPDEGQGDAREIGDDPHGVVGRRGGHLDEVGRARSLVARWDPDALEGCVDVDLEASVVTNALPVNRSHMEVGDEMGRRRPQLPHVHP